MIEAPAILPWPTPTFEPAMARAKLVNRNLRSASPVTGYQRVTSPIDARWEIGITMARMNDPDWEVVEAFFARLDGGAVFFRVHDPRRLYAKGEAAGINHVNRRGNAVDEAWSDGTNFDDGTGWTDASSYGSIAASAALGSTHVLLSGLVPDQAVALKENDRLGLHLQGDGGLMYMAVKAASSDANGHALVEVRPRLRMGVSAGEPVNFVYVSSVFTILDVPAMENTPGGTTSIGNTGFTLTEVPEVMLASVGLAV